MTNFVTASRGDELLFRIDDSVESKFFHAIVTLVSLGMPEAAALCGFDGEDHPSGRAPRRPHRLLRLHADRAHPTARIWMNGSSRCLHGRHEKTPLASNCERSGVSRVPIGAV